MNNTQQQSRRNNNSAAELSPGRYLINITQGTQPEISTNSLTPLLINLIPTEDGQLKMIPVPRTILNLDELGYDKPVGASSAGAILSVTFLRRKITRNQTLGVDVEKRYFFIATTLLKAGNLTSNYYILCIRADGTKLLYNELNDVDKQFYINQGFKQQSLDVRYIESVTPLKSSLTQNTLQILSFVEIFFCAYLDYPYIQNYNIKYLMYYVFMFTDSSDLPQSMFPQGIKIVSWNDQPVFTINSKASDPNAKYWTTIGVVRSGGSGGSGLAIDKIIQSEDYSGTIEYPSILYDMYLSVTNNTRQYSVDFTISVNVNGASGSYCLHFFGKNKCFFTSSIPYQMGYGFTGDAGKTNYTFPLIFNNLSLVYEQDPIVDVANPNAVVVKIPGIPLIQEFGSSIVNVEATGSGTVIMHFENNFTQMYQLKLGNVTAKDFNGDPITKVVPSLKIVDQKGMDGVTALSSDSGIELNDKTYIIDDSGNLRVTINKPFNYSEKLADQVPISSFFTSYDLYTKTPVAQQNASIPVQMSKSFALRYIDILGYDVLNIGDFLCASLGNSNATGSLNYSMFYLKSSEKIEIQKQSAENSILYNNTYAAPSKITAYSKKILGSWDVPSGNLVGLHNRLICFPKKYEDIVAQTEADVFDKSLFVAPVNFFLSNNINTVITKLELQIYSVSAIDFITAGIMVIAENQYNKELIENWDNDDWWMQNKVSKTGDIVVSDSVSYEAESSRRMTVAEYQEKKRKENLKTTSTDQTQILLSQYTNNGVLRCGVVSLKTTLSFPTQSFGLAIRLGGFNNAKTNKVMIEQIVVTTDRA